MQTDPHLDPHGAARSIIDTSFVSEVSVQEEEVLREHLRDCAECREYMTICSRSVSSLNGFSFSVDPALNAKVLALLAERVQQLEAKRPQRKKMLPSFLVALAFTVIGSFVVSRLASPVATVFHIQQTHAQTSWLAFWVLPSLFLSMLLPVLPRLSEGWNGKGEVL
jgi:predicted anti-sigma-YlaC factor YlaD